MKIKCPKEAIIKPLQICSGLSPQKEIYNICQFVRISAIQETLTIRATDLKISFTYHIPMEGVFIIEEGELLLPAAKLFSLIRETPEDEITLETEAGKDQKKTQNGNLVTKDGKILLLGENVEKFPEIPEFKDENAFEMPGESFLKLIQKTAFATTTEKTRYDLDNIMIDLRTENSVRFAATDGKRLAYCEIKTTGMGTAKNKQYTIPSRGLKQIEKIISTIKPEGIKFNFSDSHFIFLTKESVLSTRLSDGLFPPYDKVIPQNFPHHGKVSVKNFDSVLRRIAILIDDQHPAVDLEFSNDSLRIFIQNEQLGYASLSFPIKFSFGDKTTSITIRFNSSFIQDVLKYADSDEVEIELKNNTNALFLKDGEDFRYVVLPIRIDDRVPKEEVSKEEDDDSES